jgi:hypothetical protein
VPIKVNQNVAVVQCLLSCPVVNAHMTNRFAGRDCAPTAHSSQNAVVTNWIKKSMQEATTRLPSSGIADCADDLSQPLRPSRIGTDHISNPLEHLSDSTSIVAPEPTQHDAQLNFVALPRQIRNRSSVITVLRPRTPAAFRASRDSVGANIQNEACLLISDRI